MKPPLVTIGITAYNASDSVERAVDSALAQTWRPLEIVAVDDGSSDDTRQVLDALAERHPELRVFGNEVNSGVAVTRNHILSEARGEFLAFFDDDDRSLPERVAMQMERILDYEKDFAQGAPVICHTARLQIYPDGREITAPTMGQCTGRPAPAGWAVAERIILGRPLPDGYGACPTCSQMARLSTYKSLGGFDPAFYRIEDSDLNVRLAKAGGHFVGIAEPLVVQTMTKSSDKSLAGELRYSLMLLDKHRDVAGGARQHAFCRQWIQAKHKWLAGRRIAFGLDLMKLTASHPMAVIRRLTAALPSLTTNHAMKRFYRHESS
jgi:GT2 family glycosyltransferase